MSALEHPFPPWLCWLYIVTNDYLVLGEKKQMSNKDNFSHPSFNVFSLFPNGEKSTQFMLTAVNPYQGRQSKIQLPREST